jgi:glycosyltransferase involved in cell wall biosynthesis
MRVLVVAQDFPYPTTYGSRIRLANVVRALAELGDVDLFTFSWPGGEFEQPAAGVVNRWEVVPRPSAHRTLVEKLGWLIHGRMPSDFLGRDLGPARETFSRWVRPPYDLIWFSRIEPYVALGSLAEGPVILDIDDLVDRRLRTQSAVGLGDGWPFGASRRSLRAAPRILRERKDIRLWEGLQRRIAGSVAAAAVCSELDRERVGGPNVVVIPNGYDLPGSPVGRSTKHLPPTVLLAARFGYGANLDAASYLVREIAPVLRDRVEGLQIRLVGKEVRAVRDLADPPRVVVTGAVLDMHPELARANIVAVPIRIGSGTRIKILEAFAHKVPVVSTSLGAEGLNVRDGRHLLIADTAQGFASACERILGEPELRDSLVKDAHALFLNEYQWASIRSGIIDLARKFSATQTRTRSSSPVRT